MGAIRDALIRRTFPFWQRLGIHVRPVHFYEPIPDTTTLRDLWSQPSELVGVRMDVQRQLELLEQLASRWAN